jgi:hypothetical protein
VESIHPFFIPLIREGYVPLVPVVPPHDPVGLQVEVVPGWPLPPPLTTNATPPTTTAAPTSHKTVESLEKASAL